MKAHCKAASLWLIYWLGASSGTALAADDFLGKASWIWTAKPDAICHLRRVFTAPEEIKAAKIQITADNGYELYVNGSFVGSDVGAESSVWQSVETYDIAPLLTRGENVIGVRGTDLGGQAGFLCGATIEFASAEKIEFTSDGAWRVSASSDPTGFAKSEYREDATWTAATVLGVNGIAPWGKLSGANSPSKRGTSGARGFTEAAENFDFPSPLLLIRGRTGESSTAGSPQAVWRIGNSRACLEIDTLGPSMAGHRLELLTRVTGGPARYAERTLFDEPGSLVGSPSVSHDGRTIFLSVVPAGEKFWRVAMLSLTNNALKILTSGPFHDFDPEPLPDGRIVFSSTRIGNREEYHGNMARALFVMNGDGSNIQAITHHIVADIEPRMTANGDIVFVRQDNFMERAKVETHIHSVRPDGTAGQVLLGPDRGALAYNAPTAAEENGQWLRNFGFGSPAPLPDGRVAALSSLGLVISGNAIRPKLTLRPAVELVDIAPLPDGRLLCTLASHVGIGVLDVEKNEITRIYSKPPFDGHSVVYAGARSAPTLPRIAVESAEEAAAQPTGFFLGQSVFLTRQENADVSRIKAIRVIEGRPFATRSSRHPYDHLGVEAIELGTAPLAADGSFYIEVPADRALSIQAIDGEGRSVINELSWIYVRPGEQRSCVGCHSQRDAAPANSGEILALRRPPIKALGAGDPHRWRGNNAANGGVLNLQFERMREIASINGRSDSIESLLKELGAPDAGARIAACERLALRREKSITSALQRALGDKSAEVRMHAALALATCGERKSIAPLLDALNDVDGAVAQAASVAAQNLTGIKTAFNGFAAREERAKAAAQMRSQIDLETVESLLIARLGGAAAEREDTLNALGHIGSAAAVTAMIQSVGTQLTNDLRSTVAGLRALGAIGDTNAIPFLHEILRKNATPGANSAGDHEFGWTQAPVQMATAAAEALGRIGGIQSETILIDTFAALPNFWELSFRTADHDWLMGCHASPVHYRILEALDRMGSARAAGLVPQILKSIPIDPDRAVLFENDAYETVAARLISRTALGKAIVRSCAAVLLGEPTPSDFISAVSNSPPAISVGAMMPSARAAQILSIVSEADDASVLRESFARWRRASVSPTRNWICFYLARGLGKIGDAGSAAELMSVVKDDPTEASLGLLSPPNVFVFETATPMYRAAAADALGRLRVTSSVPALLGAAASPDNALDVRNAAANALIRLASPENAARLKTLAAGCPEISTRKLLLQAYAAATESHNPIAQ